MRRAFAAAIVIGAALAARTARAERLHLDLHRATLPNGVRVVVSVDRASPTATIEVLRRAGARDEAPGEIGLAHVVQHAVLGATHATRIAARGGATDASVGAEATSVRDRVAAEDLPLAIALEGEAFARTIDEADLARARTEVTREADARPPLDAGRARLRELLLGRAHDASSRPEEVSLEAARAFQRAFHRPDSTVVAIVGDVDPDAAIALVTRAFGGARAPSEPRPAAQAPASPASPKPAIARVESPHARRTTILYGWRIPPRGDPDRAAIESAAMLLAGGPGSRLERTLVREQPLATRVEARTLGVFAGDDVLQIAIELASPHAAAAVESLVDGELRNLDRLGASDAEITALHARAETRALVALQPTASRARALAELELFAGDASSIDGELARQLATTKDDVKRVAGRWLDPTRRARVDVVPSTLPPPRPVTPATAPSP